MKVDCKMDLVDFSKALDGIAINVTPYCAATALTKVAKTAQAAIVQKMRESFDRPTPYTLNSTFVTPATKTSLVATVGFKDRASKGLPPTVFLQPQVDGGQRQLKRSEVLLGRKGILPGGMLLVPGADAPLDSYGNMRKGTMSLVLSSLLAFGETGFTMNRSFRRGARLNAQSNNIFLVPKRAGRLMPGIYLRTKTGVKCILAFVHGAHYRPILPFAATVQTVSEANLQVEFGKALDAQLAKYGDTSFPT